MRSERIGIEIRSFLDGTVAWRRRQGTFSAFVFEGHVVEDFAAFPFFLFLL